MKYTPYLYFAYGMNMCKASMKSCCPSSEEVMPFLLPNYTLTFNYYADVKKAPGYIVPGALYRITSDDELGLDWREGYDEDCPSSGLYNKVFLDVSHLFSSNTSIMFYQMTDGHPQPPSNAYLDIVKRGYLDWGYTDYIKMLMDKGG